MKFYRSLVQILGCIVFEESFENIQRETALPVSALKDDLRQLLTNGYVTGRVGSDTNDASRMPRYDLDRLEQCYFKATRKGLSAWQTEKHKFSL